MYLNCHSFYSLRYGTFPIDKLVKMAVENGIEKLALTDINNSMGVVDFVNTCNKNNVKPVAGIEFRDGNELLYIGIARNNEGFMELNEFLSLHNINKLPLPLQAPAFNHCYVIYPFGEKSPQKLRDNEYTGIRSTELNRLLSVEFRNRQQKLVALCPITFDGEPGYELHRNLRAIDNNTLLSMLIPSQVAAPDELFTPPAELEKLFGYYPQIISNTHKLLGDCSINFDFTNPKNKKIFSASAYDDNLLLEKLAMDGMVYRYGKNNKEAKQRIKHELGIIDKQGFSSYFLITWDIIRYTMSCCI